MPVTTNQHCITFLKSKDLIYNAAEAWSHAKSTSLQNSCLYNDAITNDKYTYNLVVHFCA
jgi:hypothetical protein